jgi:hypothetical protein
LLAVAEPVVRPVLSRNVVLLLLDVAEPRDRPVRSRKTVLPLFVVAVPVSLPLRSRNVVRPWLSVLAVPIVLPLLKEAIALSYTQIGLLVLLSQVSSSLVQPFFGLFSDRISFQDFGAMFHGDNERVDVESLRLSTEFWYRLARDFLG